MSNKRNDGIEFDAAWLDRIERFQEAEVDKICSDCKTAAARQISHDDNLLKLVSKIDLTTLSGDDTPDRVRALVRKAVNPLNQRLSEEPSIHCAAVCTYPARILDVLMEKQISDPQDLVSVASAVYHEVKAMREAAGNSHLKTILATGELQNFDNIYKASLVVMMAGSDFIKTSTGKETVNATLPASFVMCKAIRAYWERTGYKVGFKAAGGIKTPIEALSYQILVEKVVGEDWLNSGLFRIGASSLLDNIIQEHMKQNS